MCDGRGKKQKQGEEKNRGVGGRVGEVGLEWVREFDPHVGMIVSLWPTCVSVACRTDGD